MQVEIAVKYAGYIDRQEDEVARFRTLEDKRIPDGMDYSLVPSLRSEARQKLTKIRPGTIGQAGRISGITPADISILLVSMKRGAATVVEGGVCQRGAWRDAECSQHLLRGFVIVPRGTFLGAGAGGWEGWVGASRAAVDCSMWNMAGAVDQSKRRQVLGFWTGLFHVEHCGDRR